MEDHGYDESHQGPVDSVFTIPGAAAHGLRLSAPHAVWPLDRGGPVADLPAHGISIVFTWPAAVISAVVVSFPLVPVLGARCLRGLDAQMLDAARTLGWSEQRHPHQTHDAARLASIAAGTVLAFARAMGEFWLHAVLCGQLCWYYADHPHRHLF